MQDLADRVVAIAKSALLGYLSATVVVLSAVVFFAGAAYVANASSFDVGFGPMPLMSYWHTDEGWGFHSEWGLGLVPALGAIAGIVLGRRHRWTLPA